MTAIHSYNYAFSLKNQNGVLQIYSVVVLEHGSMYTYILKGGLCLYTFTNVVYIHL